MPSQLFSIEEDLLFQEGEIKGEIKGKIEGMSQKTLEIIINLTTGSDHDDEFIARMAGVREETVTKIREIILEFPEDFQERLEAMNLQLVENFLPKN